MEVKKQYRNRSSSQFAAQESFSSTLLSAFLSSLPYLSPSLSLSFTYQINGNCGYTGESPPTTLPSHPLTGQATPITPISKAGAWNKHSMKELAKWPFKYNIKGEGRRAECPLEG